MKDYKELFYRSQATIADAIENLENISEQLKKCMQDCENDIISENNKVIYLNNKNEGS